MQITYNVLIIAKKKRIEFENSLHRVPLIKINNQDQQVKTRRE